MLVCSLRHTVQALARGTQATQGCRPKELHDNAQNTVGQVSEL